MATRWQERLASGDARPDISIAVDEIYDLRAMLADEADILEQHLELRTFPKSRRAMAQASIKRMRQAAQGDLENAMRPGMSRKRALRHAGASDVLTNQAWAAQHGLEEVESGVRTSSRPAMSEETANEVFDVLVRHAGRRDDPDARLMFVRAQTDGWRGEFRFGGSLGSGGKFRRNFTRLNVLYDLDWASGDLWGEGWYVDCYPEDSTPERQAIIKATNAALQPIRDRYFGIRDEVS